MIRHSGLTPATAFTWGDKVRILTGALILMLGIVMLWRVLPLGITPQSIVVGVAFIGFGVHRLWLGYVRLQEWTKGK